MQRSHSGPAGQCAVPAFHGGNEFLEGSVGGIVVAGVAVALLFLAEDAVELLHGIVEVARRRVNRSRNGVGLRLLAVASMDRRGVDQQYVSDQ